MKLSDAQYSQQRRFRQG